MPITIPVSYRDYRRLLAEGKLDLGGLPCPSLCPDVFLQLSTSRVSRGLLVLEDDGFGRSEIAFLQAVLALAYCSSCKARPRVLPCDALPRKTYSLPVIEKTATAHAAGGRSLRDVAWKLWGERTPSHTTLHAWTEGLGAFALGRAGGEIDDAVPASRLLSETASRHPGLDVRIDVHRHVDERRYQSEGRQERLAAVASLLEIAASVSGAQTPNALTEWRRLALTWTGVDMLRFPTGISCTRIEQVGAQAAAPSPATPVVRGRTACRPRSRSPPSDSS